MEKTLSEYSTLPSLRRKHYYNTPPHNVATTTLFTSLGHNCRLCKPLHVKARYNNSIGKSSLCLHKNITTFSTQAKITSSRTIFSIPFVLLSESILYYPYAQMRNRKIFHWLLYIPVLYLNLYRQTDNFKNGPYQNMLFT